MKSIPIALQSHLDEDATTLCQLTLIETKDGTVYGFTDLDMDVVYDDGDGSVTYQAENGFTPSRMQASADLAVDNAEINGLVMDTGITEAQIRAGLFDYARVKVYRVNYMDLTQGHEVIASGTAGETTFSANGWKTEFRSLTQQLKQPISKLYSLTCRVAFGSAQCGKSFTWVSGTVTDVGANPKRQFTDTALTEGEDYFKDGVVEWLTGNNAEAQMEVDEYLHSSSNSPTFALALPMPYAIQVGDTYRVRKDCSKEWGDADNGCLFHWAADRALHFRGEPHIPIADGGQNMVPGAMIDRA
jgi:uncharacterized phage protein (TIGR02218 family)